MYEQTSGYGDLYYWISSRLRRRRNLWRARRTAGWGRVDAVIRDAQAHVIDQAQSMVAPRYFVWRPVIRYEYQVENTTYSGNAKGDFWFFDEDDAADTAESLIGVTLPIRYDPSRPSKSFYLPQDGGPPQLNPAVPDAKSGLVILSLKK